jgi:hypothetical protein
MHVDATTIEALTERVRDLEHSLTLAHTQISSMRAATNKSSRARAALTFLNIGLICGVVVLGHARAIFADEQGHTVTAPFIVLSRSGQKLLKVEDYDHDMDLVLYDRAGRTAAGLLANDRGGHVVINGPDEKTRGALGVDNDGTGYLVLRDNEQRLMADISRGKKGGQGLGVYDRHGDLKLEAFATADNEAQISLKKGPNENLITLLVGQGASTVYLRDNALQPVALLGKYTHDENSAEGSSKSVTHRGLSIYGESGSPVIEAKLDADGDGNIKVKAGSDPDLGVFLGFGDKEPVFCLHTKGKCQVALGVSDGKPGINMSSASGASLVNLAEGSFGEGILQLGNSSGTSIVEAGATEDGRGIVRAFPYAAGGGMGLFPGAYIRGRPFNQ